MVKPNERCPCKSGKKYKKCCKKKGLFTKKADDLPSLWKNLGESDPSLRFAVGERVEGCLGELNINGEPKWTPGTIRNLNVVLVEMAKGGPQRVKFSKQRLQQRLLLPYR